MKRTIVLAMAAVMILLMAGMALANEVSVPDSVRVKGAMFGFAVAFAVALIAFLIFNIWGLRKFGRAWPRHLWPELSRIIEGSRSHPCSLR